MIRQLLLACALALALAAPAQAQKAVFDINCDISHSLPDDPILFPGEPGMSHLHDFAGARTTDAFSTGQSLLAAIEADPGASNCREGFGIVPQNGTGYWFPAMWWNGTRVVPDDVHIYYRNASRKPDVLPFPTDFRLVIGDPARDRDYQRLRMHWICHGQAGASNFLDLPLPEGCRGLRSVRLLLVSATCWNGELDSFDHRSHVVYREEYRFGCPASHSLLLPRLSIYVSYPILAATGKLIDPDTDSFLLGTLGEPGMELQPWQAHGDLMSAWVPPRLQLLVDFCLNERHDCKRFPPPDPAQDVHDRG